MTTINTAPRKQTFWVNLHGFFDGLWGIVQHAIIRVFTYVIGDDNSVNLSGKIVRYNRNTNVNLVVGTMYVMGYGVEEFCKEHPELEEELKGGIQKKACAAQIPKFRKAGKWGWSLEANTLADFIKSNFPEHKNARKRAHAGCFLATHGVNEETRKGGRDAEEEGCDMLRGDRSGTKPGDRGLPGLGEQERGPES